MDPKSNLVGLYNDGDFIYKRSGTKMTQGKFWNLIEKYIEVASIRTLQAEKSNAGRLYRNFLKDGTTQY